MPVKGKGKECVHEEMRRWKAGKLHSGTGKKGKDGPVVKDQKQAIAIALSVCGKSDHSERDLENIFREAGFSKKSSKEAAKMLFKQPDWGSQFRTGETHAQLPRESVTTIAPSFPGFDADNRPGRQKGDQGKQRRVHSQSVYPVSIPKGNPQQGPRSRSDVKGMAAFDEAERNY